MTKQGRRILYLSYDGMTDNIGQSQVLPYLAGCARAGHRITLVSFEKPELMDARGSRVSAEIASAGIDWQPRRFRSFPPLLSKLLDQRAMIRSARHLLEAARAQDEPYDLVHARSYVAASGALAALQPTDQFLFDMRGFWVDQRREGGRWRSDRPLGLFLYRRWKALERRMLARADHIVVLAAAARERLRTATDAVRQPISVIPCCADARLFGAASPAERDAARKQLGIARNALVLAWLGSRGTVYRPDLHYRFFDIIRTTHPSAVLLFIGPGTVPEIIAEAAATGVALEPCEIRLVSVGRQEVPAALAAADLGSCFITPQGSSAGVSPTKLGEMLISGIPVIANRGVGDVESQIAAVQGGHVIAGETEADLAAAAEAVPELLDIDRSALRQRAVSLFDLDRAIAAYDRLYQDPSTAQDISTW